MLSEVFLMDFFTNISYFYYDIFHTESIKKHHALCGSINFRSIDRFAKLSEELSLNITLFSGKSHSRCK